MKVVVGSLSVIFFDTIIGLIILLAGLATIIWIHKIRKQEDHELLVAQLHIIIGVLMLIGASILLVTSESQTTNKIIIKTTIGLILIIKGFYELRLKMRRSKY